MLIVLPTDLREPRQTVRYAERPVVLSRRTDPTLLMLLAQAYQEDGQSDKARSTALDGLKLIASPAADAPPSRCRILLEQILSQATPNPDHLRL